MRWVRRGRCVALRASLAVTRLVRRDGPPLLRAAPTFIVLAAWRLALNPSAR
jgi:hypothetical protein